MEQVSQKLRLKRYGEESMGKCKNTQNKSSADKGGLRNLLHVIIIAALILYTFYAVIADGGITIQNFWGELSKCILLASINDIFTFIGALAFILFGIVGMYEFAYTNGLRRILPPFYLKFREERDERTAKAMMKTYYEQDINFIQQYEAERANRILQALGLKEKQFHHIQYELVRARSLPEDSQEEMKKKLKQLIYQKDFIVDQSEIPIDKRCYPDVNYFINLYTALYDSQLCTNVGNIFAAFIALSINNSRNSLADIDYIVVPYGSNLLLGLETGKKLAKPVVVIQEQPRILNDCPWDGNYEPKPGCKNRIIIIHDVLVTGKRIYESIEKLPADTYSVEGLYCLIRYKHNKFQPTDELHKHSINNIHCLIQTDEATLKGVFQKKG